MPFCPECGYEYKEGVTACADCGVTLVDRLDDTPPEQVEWVPLHNLPGVAYAEMVKEALAREGIPSFIKSDTLTGAYGVKGTSTVGAICQLFVPESFYQRSAEILDQMLNHI